MTNLEEKINDILINSIYEKQIREMIVKRITKEMESELNRIIKKYEKS